uniref:RING finger protein 43 n=1 Tax=Lygus hesperus TaxID=30085 RepID=A0A0A9W4J3_LYGHE
MAQIILGRVVVAAVIVGAGAAASAALLIRKKAKKYREGKCTLCGQDLDSENMRICVLKCRHKFHDNCIRAYVHSIRDCKMKCPMVKCTEKDAMGVAERKHFEQWAPDVMYYCNVCCKVVEKVAVQSLPCGHGFCKQCLKAYIGTLITMELPFKCPMEDCVEEIPQPVADLILGANN